MLRYAYLLVPLATAAVMQFPSLSSFAQTPTEIVPLPIGGGPNEVLLLPYIPGQELRVFDPSLIDKSIDPCDNFYRYSCNGWFKRNPLPADQTSYGRFAELYELNRLHLKQILEEASTPTSTRSVNEQKIGDEYATCMDTAAIDSKGIAPLQPELDSIAALKNKAELPALVAHLH